MSLGGHIFGIKGKLLLPIVQGGMGIGISAGGLAGTVAREGGVGTIASVGLRHLHPDLLERSAGNHDNAIIVEANREALDREIRKARSICGDDGFIAVNVMRAVTEWKGLVEQACASGAKAIVMGAGLPLELPELTAGYPDVALIPILSEERGVRIVLKRWMRHGRLPDAIVIEHPRYAGGHLGARDAAGVDDAKFEFERVLPAVFAVFRELGLAEDAIPVVPAGGINTPEKVRALLARGASAVQVGTPFAVTVEGDAHPAFKQVLLRATADTIRVFMSTAGLPARAVMTPWLSGYLRREETIRAARIKREMCVRGVDCLAYCGLRDRDPTPAGRFCIETLLAKALHGDVEKGLFFRGSQPTPFADVRPVRELIAYLLGSPDGRSVRGQSARGESSSSYLADVPYALSIG